MINTYIWISRTSRIFFSRTYHELSLCRSCCSGKKNNLKGFFSQIIGCWTCYIKTDHVFPLAQFLRTCKILLHDNNCFVHRMAVCLSTIFGMAVFRCRLAPNTWHLTSCVVSCRPWNTPDNLRKYQTVFNQLICYQVSADILWRLYNSRLFLLLLAVSWYGDCRIDIQYISGSYCLLFTA